MLDSLTLSIARLCEQVYNDEPQFGRPSWAARGRLYPIPGGAQVLVFRGTDNAATTIADLDAITLPVQGLGSVHQGFWVALSTVLPAIFASPKPLYIAGHSEGAALATLCAGALALTGNPPAAVYGFEPPRVSADTILGELLDDSGVVRFYTRNGSDPVPELPPALMLPGTLTQIGNAPSLIPNVSDHLIKNVVAVIEGAI